MDKTISSESIIDPHIYILQNFSLSEGLPSSKLDEFPWILSRIIWHLAKSRRQGPSTLLCISQVYHCRTTISRFTYHECLYEFCLTCVVQLHTYLKIQQSWQVALSSHSLFCKKLFSSKHIVLNSKQFCFCVVIEEYQTFWNNLHKATLIWFGFLSISNICLLYPNFKKRQYGFNIPISYLIWCHFNRFDGALFSVNVVVTNA